MTARGNGARSAEAPPLGSQGQLAAARTHITAALLLLILLVIAGTFGYMTIEGWNLIESLYMVVIALTTVGFGEVHPLSPAGRILTMFVIVLGVGTTAYALGIAGKIVLEDRIRAVLGRRAMEAIHQVRDHYIICGYGRMGRIICEELSERRIPFVVLETADDPIEELERLGFPYMRANATIDEELIEAGIMRASGLVSVVTDDTQNVFIVLTARGLNPKLHIVARSAAEENIKKLVRAGANKVVSPYYLGGHRIAQAIVSPTVLDFLETIVHNKQMDLRLEEVRVSPGAALDGANLAECGLRKDYNVIILAIKSASGEMNFNPASDAQIRAGDILVVLGRKPDLERLVEVARGQ